MSTSFLFLTAILVLALIPVSAYAIPTDTLKRYPVIGSHIGTVNASLGQVIDMQGMSALTWIFNITGTNNFTNTVLTVQVNQEGGGNDWYTAGTISLGNVTNVTSIGRTFSNANYTGFPYNPAGFPFVRITTDAGVNGTIPSLYWTGTLN